uniref:Uncharacterized protein n=1 Tax=Solanum tuberosum TaxID=4113 RepID=M1DYY0_SOLTU
MFYRGNKKAFFLPRLNTALCKWTGVPLLDTEEAAAESDDDGGDDNRSTRSQSPLSSARVEEDLAAVRRRLGRAFSDTTLIPPITTLEVGMLRYELRQEMRKGLKRDRLLVRIWKTMNIIFTYVALRQEIPGIEKGDFQHFSFMDEAVNGLVPPEELDSDDDTS